MANGKFNSCVTLTLWLEGGYVNNPNDPGGETKYGISKRAHPNVDIANLTLDEAKEIYLDEYWMPSGCENLPTPLDLCVFDAAVNSGITRAAQWLKECGGDWAHFNILRINRFIKYSIANENARKNFFWGWMNRMFHVNTACIEIETTNAEAPTQPITDS